MTFPFPADYPRELDPSNSDDSYYEYEAERRAEEAEDARRDEDE